MDNINPRKKKKVDFEALNSPLARIPGMNLTTVRVLLDSNLGLPEDLKGRSPEAIFDAALQMNPELPGDTLYYLRMGVYFAESANPDPARLVHWEWKF